MRSRVVMHTPEPFAGSAQYVSSLVKALLDAGTHVVLFCPRNFAYIPDLAAAGATIFAAGKRGTAPAGLPARIGRNLRFFAGMVWRQICLTRSGDTVHFQFPLYFPAGLALFILAKLQARAIVYTAHDPLPHKWLLPPALRFFEHGSLACAYRLSNRIVVHNEAARELLADVFAESRSKIAVIPHGATALRPDEVPFHESDALELLQFGSIREDKGIELAIQAVRNVNAGGLKVRLLIAGAVANAREQTYWDSCKREIAGAGEGIIVLERFIPDEDVPGLLAGCHAVLLPYKNFPSESGVAAVALGHGRAILAADCGSFSALLHAVDLGIPINTPTVASVEKAIRAALAAGPRELREKGLRGLAFVSSTRSWETVGRKTADLYQELDGPVLTNRETTHA